jgi:hypothetical protein
MRCLPSVSQDITASIGPRVQANLSIALFICVHLRNLRPIPSCVLGDSAPQWQPLVSYSRTTTEDDPQSQSNYFPELRFAFFEKGLHAFLWSSEPNSR